MSDSKFKASVVKVPSSTRCAVSSFLRRCFCALCISFLLQNLLSRYTRPCGHRHWRVTLADRGKYGARDGHLAGRGGRPGANEPVFTIRMTYADQALAEAAAKAKLAEFTRGEARLSLTLPGRPDLFAEAPLTVTDIRPGVDGAWLIERITHALDTSGWVTRVEAATARK
ncbi:MAG: hypothetical protein AAF442_05100 [Pseudomonadota bacterium]